MGNLKALNDKRVIDFIVWSRTAGRQRLRDRGTGDTVDTKAINHAAWQLLKSTVRGDARHRYDRDFDAAAAEHYMYIRYLASATGDPYCHLAPAMYAAKKFFDQLTGRLQKGQAQSGHPVLPANPYVVAWGQRGVKDGLEDFKQASGGADYRLGGAIEALASFNFSADTARKMGAYAKDPLSFAAAVAKGESPE